MPHAREMIDRPGDPGRRQTDQRWERSTQGGSGQNIAQTFALIVGVTYLLVGVVGFAVTGFTGVVSDGADKLLGFDLNVFHNVVHLAIGAGLIVFSRMDATITQGVLIGAGLVYVLAGLLGFLNQLQILSIDSEIAPDNFLHLFSGMAAVLFGLAGVRQSEGTLRAV